MQKWEEQHQDLAKLTARKGQEDTIALCSVLPDHLDAWISRYLALAISGVRSPAVTQKITLHLARFLAFFRARYGHDHVSACLKRDVVAW